MNKLYGQSGWWKLLLKLAILYSTVTIFIFYIKIKYFTNYENIFINGFVLGYDMMIFCNFSSGRRRKC